MVKIAPIFDEYVSNVVASFSDLDERQGSRAFGSFFSASQYIPAYQWILNNLADGSSVLDWGCGTGHFSHFLHKFGFSVIPYGFEFPNFLEHVDCAAVNNFVLAKSETLLPFKNNTFDLVTSIGVLEHVREFGGTEHSSLIEVARVLKPGGLFFCYHFPNKGSWIEKLNGKFGIWSHPFTYDQSDVLRICDGTDLSIVACGRYGFIPRNIFGSRLLNCLGSAKSFAAGLEVLDDACERIFPSIVQNHFFVAKKLEFGSN